MNLDFYLPQKHHTELTIKNCENELTSEDLLKWKQCDDPNNNLFFH